MSKEDKTKLDGLPAITFEKVGKCNDNRYCSIKRKGKPIYLKTHTAAIDGLESYPTKVDTDKMYQKLPKRAIMDGRMVWRSSRKRTSTF